MINNQMGIRILSAIRYRSNSTLGNSTVWRWRQSLGIITDKILKEKEAFYKLVLLAYYLREHSGRGIADFCDLEYAKNPLAFERQVRKEVSEAVDFLSEQDKQIYKVEEVFLWD